MHSNSSAPEEAASRDLAPEEATFEELSAEELAAEEQQLPSGVQPLLSLSSDTADGGAPHHSAPHHSAVESPRAAAVESKATVPRRIAALVLPDLLLELAWSQFCTDTERRGGKLGFAVSSTRKAEAKAPPLLASGLPFAAVLLDDQEVEGEIPATAPLSAVNTVAQRFGVRSGQSIAEACALVSNLVVQELPQQAVIRELQRLAEVALGFGVTVSYEAPDTVWVDISGAARLFSARSFSAPHAAANLESATDVGAASALNSPNRRLSDEEQLALQLADRVRQASAFEGGHAVRVVVADGPRVAQALARWGRLSREGILIVDHGETKHKLAELPVVALPLDLERTSWLSRLGLHSIGDVARLPASAASGRLGDQAQQVLALCQGYDPEPLTPYRPPELLVEQSSWDDSIDGVEPLSFVVRGLVSRLSSRLEGRGEAAQLLELVVHHDRAIARLREVAPSTLLRFELSAPLWREAELVRVVRSRLDSLKLVAPSVGLELRAPVITHATAGQLDLARSLAAGGKARTSGAGPESLPVLLAELVADLGKDRVGVLELVDSHRPEEKSRLVGVRSLLAKKRSTNGQRAKRAKQQRSKLRADPQPLLPCGKELDVSELPSRLFSQPLALSNVSSFAGQRTKSSTARQLSPARSASIWSIGTTLSFARRLYTITQARFESRLDGVEWWTTHPVSRDYWRLTLESQSQRGLRESFDVLVFSDRLNGGHFLQGIYD